MIKIIKTNLGSSVIDSIAYVDKREEGFRATLLIKFHSGRIYNYRGIPIDEVFNLLEASSAGKYYNSEIKNNYNCTEVSHDIEQLANSIASTGV